MPTISAHVDEDMAKQVDLAAKASEQKRPGPYIAEAVRQRMQREGMLRGDPRAELICAAEEVGVENALIVLRRAARAKKKAA